MASFFDAATNVRRLAALERAAGLAITGLGALCFVMWWTGRAADRHGMIFVYLGGTFLLPLGILLWAAGRTLAPHRRLAWPLQLLVLGWPWLYAALFRLQLLP